MIASFVNRTLSSACDDLRSELAKVTPQVMVVHRGPVDATLEVHIAPPFKAYVPRTWNTFPVEFHPWSGRELLELDEVLK